MSNHFYTYVYLNPLKDNEPFYVGYGIKKRWKTHLTESKNIIKKKKSTKWIQKNCTNPHKIFTIRKILKSGLEPLIAKKLENATKQEAIDKEIELIALYGRSDKGLGSLTNKTEGGDGGATISRDILLGKRFGRLIVLDFASDSIQGKPRWICKCECGIEKIIEGRNLKAKLTNSCGCLHRERKTTHGMWGTSEYDTWHSLCEHISNPNHKKYESYHKNNIKVCDRWLESFENFYEDMGNRPSDKYVLGRKNINGDFDSSNCIWLTRKAHANNRKNTKYLTINGESKPITEWSTLYNISYNILWGRIRRGWSPEEAVFGK